LDDCQYESTHRYHNQGQGYEFQLGLVPEVEGAVALFGAEPDGVEYQLEDGVGEHRIGSLDVIRVLQRHQKLNG
jgi:hypothetical protein